jgi:RNA polymerase primary sigma factor
VLYDARKLEWAEAVSIWETVPDRPLLDRESEAALLERSRSGDRQARTLLVESNVRLVFHVARRQMGRGLALADLVQEGIVGLIRAIDGFNRTDVRLVTYAYPWILTTIQKAIVRYSGLTFADHGALSRLIGIQERLEIRMGREPAPDELAKAAGLTPARTESLMEMFCAAGNPIRLSEMAEETDSFDLEDPSPGPEARILARMDGRGQWLKLLSVQEKLVLTLRLGLDDEAALTLSEVGEGIGLCRERVRQIEARALLKIREAL